MSTLYLILTIVGAYYLIEVFVAVPPGTVLFRSLLGGRFRALPAATGVRIRDRLYVVATTWLPSSRCHLTELPPWGAGEEPAALIAAAPYALPPDVPAPEDWRVPWSEVRRAIADARTVAVDRRAPIACATAAGARHAALAIGAAAGQGPTRADLTLALRASLDVAAIREARSAYEEASRSPRFGAVMLGLYLFGALPAIEILQVPLAPWRMLAAYGILLVAQQVAFFAAHRRLYPSERAARWWRVAAMVVSPAEALHAPRRLGLESLGAFHPMAVAMALCAPAERDALAGALLRGARFPAAPPNLTLRVHAPELEAFVRANDLDPQTLLAPPVLEPGVVAYCPRCLEQLTRPGECPHCPGVSLVVTE